MSGRAVWLAAFFVTLAGCERAVHQMYDQPKYGPLSPSQLFADGNSARPQVAGTVAREPRAWAAAASAPAPITLPLLARGRERFEIFCAPCHGAAGFGDGMVARRGFPAPPSYHLARLRNAPDAHFFQVISEGYGVMYPYADRISPQDRWAIIAYIRALQLSQNLPAASLDARDRSALQAGAR